MATTVYFRYETTGRFRIMGGGPVIPCTRKCATPHQSTNELLAQVRT